MFEPVAGDGNAARFALTLCPDGVYRVDGRVIPVRDDSALSVDDGQPVVSIERKEDVSIGGLGSVLGVNVKK